MTSALVLVILPLLLDGFGASPVQYSCRRQGQATGEMFVFPTTGLCYELFMNKWKTYVDAASTCRSYGGVLASVTTVDIENVLKSAFAKYTEFDKDVWIGLSSRNNDGDYAWEDGSQFYYTRWGNNEGPDNPLRAAENCVAMDYSGVWHDYRCLQRGFWMVQNFPPLLPFVCQYQAYQLTSPVAMPGPGGQPSG